MLRRIIVGRRVVIVIAVMLGAVLLCLGAFGVFRPLGNPPTLWVVRMGTHNDSRVEASVAVSNGLVYVAAEEPAPGRYPWGENHFLQALDARTGIFRWHCEVGGYAARTPVVQDGSVYFVSVNSKLYALDAITGQVRWTFDGVGDEGSTPVVGHGAVYIEIPGKTVAFDNETGNVLWIDVISNPMTPLVTSDTVYPVDNDTLYAVDPHTGNQKWKFRTDRSTTAPPVEANGIIYLPVSTSKVGPQLVALDSKTGEERWRVTLGEGVINEVHIANGIAYAVQVTYMGGEGPIYGYLTAIDLATHKEKWRYAAGRFIHGAVIGNGAIYFAAGDELRAVSISTGEQNWRYVASRTINAPTLADNILYLGDWNGYLYAIPVPEDERGK